MWEINLNLQIEGFLWSVVVGSAFCVAFDILNITEQKATFSKKRVFIVDILYFLVVAFISFFLFLAFCNGEIRWFIFAGELIGFFLCKKTLSKLYTPIILIILSLVKRLFLLIKRLILRPVCLFFYKISKNVNKLSIKRPKNTKKA